MTIIYEIEEALKPLDVGMWAPGVSRLGWAVKVDHSALTLASVVVNSALEPSYADHLRKKVHQTLIEAGIRQLPTGEYTR